MFKEYNVGRRLLSMTNLMAKVDWYELLFPNSLNFDNKVRIHVAPEKVLANNVFVSAFHKPRIGAVANPRQERTHAQSKAEHRNFDPRIACHLVTA